MEAKKFNPDSPSAGTGNWDRSKANNSVCGFSCQAVSLKSSGTVSWQKIEIIEMKSKWNRVFNLPSSEDMFLRDGELYNLDEGTWILLLCLQRVVRPYLPSSLLTECRENPWHVTIYIVTIVTLRRSSNWEDKWKKFSSHSVFFCCLLV